MSDEDRARWDARYSAPGDRTGAHPSAAEPKRFVREVAALAPGPGDVLDLACGEGQALAWLGARGWRGTGVDVSGVGLDKARARAAAAGLTVELVRADLDDWDPGERQWDLVLCVHFLDRALVPRVQRAVRPGGLAAMEVLTEGRFGASPAEVWGFFPGWRTLRTAEGFPLARARVASIVARRP